MQSPIAVPTDKAGELFIPALGKKFQQVELREDDVYDTVRIPKAAIAAGSEYILFRDVQGKEEQHANLAQSRRIASGDEVAVFRIGLHVRGNIGNVHAASLDVKQVLENGQLYVQFNKRIITAGPAIKYPTGYGISGFSNEAAAAGIAALSVGVPSVAAAPTLFVPQQLKDNDDIIAKLRFPDASGWFTGYVVPTLTVNDLAVTCFMRGVIKSPLGK